MLTSPKSLFHDEHGVVVAGRRRQWQNIHHHPPKSRYTMLQNKASAAATEATKSKEEEQHPTIRKSMMRIVARFQSLPFKVGSFYLILGIFLTCYSPLTPMESTVTITLLWMGFVLAISFMEAWVKFQAPFLPRHYGLDVGRTVFPVLNAVEMAFCVGLWLAQRQLLPRQSWMTLGGATLILLSQVVYVTPQLVLLGKHVLVDAFPVPQPEWSNHQQQVHYDLQSRVQQTPRPSSKLHVVYVLQELIKVILLGVLAWNCRALP
jgi:hypothetical protein